MRYHILSGQSQMLFDFGTGPWPRPSKADWCAARHHGKTRSQLDGRLPTFGVSRRAGFQRQLWELQGARRTTQRYYRLLTEIAPMIVMRPTSSRM